IALFDFKSENHFVASSDGIILQVYDLTNHSIQKTHSKKVATIQTVLDGDDDDEVPYNGILFFDGLGRIEGQKALTTLAQHLKSLHLLVSPEGYCFQDVSELGVYSDFGIHYLRLNDLFSWPCHGVELATTSNVWSRVKLKYHLPKHKNTSSKPTVGGGVSKEKYAELGKLVKEKDEELEKLKEEMEEELEKQKEDMEDAIKAKNEELQKFNKEKDEEIRKILKRKDVDLRALQNKKDDGDEKSKKIEELKKKKEEMELADKTKDEELKEATEKLYSGIAQAKKELEHCQKNSWAILPSTKFISQSLDANDKYLATRQPVPPGTFTCFSQSSFPYVSNSHKLVDKMRIDCDYNVKLVDEESSLAEWPPLPTMIVRIGRGNENFDKNNWWYLKTTHPEGGLTMVVFYDGNRSRISLDNYYNEGGDNVIPLPCSIDLEVYSYVYTFSIFRLRPFGVRFGFAYRPK
ncbi:hypothetical protein LINPERHAP2_LOCUS37182, partial [Linum perenne]